MFVLAQDDDFAFVENLDINLSHRADKVRWKNLSLVLYGHELIEQTLRDSDDGTAAVGDGIPTFA